MALGWVTRGRGGAGWGALPLVGWRGGWRGGGGGGRCRREGGGPGTSKCVSLPYSPNVRTLVPSPRESSCMCVCVCTRLCV